MVPEEGGDCSGLRHRFTRPYTPRTNGKAERFIQSALRKWAYARAYDRSAQRIAVLLRWLHGYNWHRPHASLAGRPPVSRLGLTRKNVLRLHNYTAGATASNQAAAPINNQCSESRPKIGTWRMTSDIAPFRQNLVTRLS